MQELITIIEDEPRVSHIIVAQNTEVKVESVQTLITKNIDNFEEFGPLRFKIGRVNNGKGLQPKTYYLNEPQSTFLMTLLRNKPIVVEFKKRLVKSFYDLKAKQHTKPPELIEVMATMMQNQQRQTDALIDLTGAVVSLLADHKENSRDPRPSQLQSQESDAPISHQQKRRLREVIEDKADYISRETGMSRKSVLPGMWVALKDFFDVREYGELRASQLTAVHNWVLMYEPRTAKANVAEVCYVDMPQL